MKKTLLVALVLAAVAGLAVASVAYAQGPQPTGGPTTPGAGYGAMMSQGQEGPLHKYMLAAMAEALGISASRRLTWKPGWQAARPSTRSPSPRASPQKTSRL